MKKEQNLTVMLLQDQLERKIDEFTRAEEEGRSRDELIGLYKQLKDLRYQLALKQMGLRPESA